MEERQVVWSVSLIPYHEQFGYMVCKEARSNKSYLQTHPIGGKVEATDRDPLYAALREFVEETKIDVITQRGALIYQDLEPLLSEVVYWDVAVGQKVVIEEEYLQSKLHRFYLWNITFLEEEVKEHLILLPTYYMDLPPETKEKIDCLLWMTRKKLRWDKKKSSLMNMFFLSLT